MQYSISTHSVMPFKSDILSLLTKPRQKVGRGGITLVPSLRLYRNYI